MTTTELTAAEVRSIRAELGWSRDRLARRLGLSEGAIRAWEEGRNPCSGPAAVLLGLLKVDRRLLDAPERQSRLPDPRACPGSEDWYRTQRLLGLLLDTEHQGYGYWSSIVAEEGLNTEWLDSMEYALLLRCSRKNPEIRITTEAAHQAFRLDVWKSWVHETHGKGFDTRHLEPMPPAEYERRVSS